MIYSNYFSIYFTLSLIGGSLFGMDTYSSTGKTSESRSGSKLSALNFARAQYELLRKHPDTKQEAREKFRATISDIYGLTSSNKTIRPTSSNNDSIVVRYLPDGTAVIDCTRLRLKENPRFRAQEQLFARINAAKQIDKINAIRATASKKTLLADLKALRAIDATNVQVHRFTADGSDEYQSSAQALGKATIALCKRENPNAVVPLNPNDISFDVSQAHQLIDHIIGNLEHVESDKQIKCINDLYYGLNGKNQQTWLEACVQLQSIAPLNADVEEHLGKKMLSLIHGMKYPKAQEYARDRCWKLTEIQEGFNAAIGWLQKSLNDAQDLTTDTSKADKHKVDNSKLGDTQRDNAALDRFKRVTPQIDPTAILKSVKDFNQEPSHAHKQMLLLLLPEPDVLKSSDKSRYFLDVIKMHLENNDLAKAQNYCAKYIACVEQA